MRCRGRAAGRGRRITALGGVLSLGLALLARPAVARDLDDAALAGIWMPKDRRGCARADDPSALVLEADHSARFLAGTYAWYRVDNIIVLHKPAAADPAVESAAKAATPALAILVAKPERDAFDATILLLGDASAFRARMFRCPPR